MNDNPTNMPDTVAEVTRPPEPNFGIYPGSSSYRPVASATHINGAPTVSQLANMAKEEAAAVEARRNAPTYAPLEGGSGGCLNRLQSILLRITHNGNIAVSYDPAKCAYIIAHRHPTCNKGGSVAKLDRTRIEHALARIKDYLPDSYYSPRILQSTGGYPDALPASLDEIIAKAICALPEEKLTAAIAGRSL